MSFRFGMIVALSAISLNAIPIAASEEAPLSGSSARIDTVKKGNLFLGGEYLFWKVNEDGLDYAQTGYERLVGNVDFFDTPIAAATISGKIVSVDPQGDSGVRVRGGYNTNYDFWTVDVAWTHFITHTNREVVGDLLILWGSPSGVDTDFATSADSSWKWKFNRVDLLLGYDCWVGQRFSLKSSVGLSWYAMDQSLNLTYEVPALEGDLSHYHIRPQEKLDAVGVRFGCDPKFHLGRGWSLYALFAGTVAYSFVDTSLNGETGSVSVLSTYETIHPGIFSLEYGLGFLWDSLFSGDNYHIAFYGGWEGNLWLSVNQFPRLTGSLGSSVVERANGNLLAQGATVGFRIDF